jgi:hypothetical protein
MEERRSFSDAELRHALLRHMDGTREVEPALTEELVRRGHLTAPPGPPHVTASGRDLLGMDAPLDEDIKAVVLASQQLRHVIPVGAERNTSDGGRIVVTSVEVWSHEVIVHWTEICTEISTRRPWSGDSPDPYESVSLTDDVGTAYVRAGGGGGGSLYTQQMNVRFLGTPPATASTLWLALSRPAGENGSVRIDLP